MSSAILPRAETAQICSAIEKLLSADKAYYERLNAAISNDTTWAFEQDYAYAVTNLRQYTSNQYDTFEVLRHKPKGNVLLFLSYNEPLIMNIFPILHALVAGNRVSVRPSRSALELAKKVWLPIQEQFPALHSKLTFVDGDPDVAYGLIPKMQAVFFFGSEHNAKKVAQECAKHLVEFQPEIEGADFAVFKHDSPTVDFEAYAEYLLTEAFHHSGQRCQRLQGIYVHRDNLGDLTTALSSRYHQLQSEHFIQFMAPQLSATQDKLFPALTQDIEAAHPENVISASSDIPVIIFEPNESSLFIDNAYFLPTFWVKSYESTGRLLNLVSKRKYRSGMNIFSDNKEFTDQIVADTDFARYTINSQHSLIRPTEGWGGCQPTGYGGNMHWLEKFSDRYTVINDGNLFS